MKKYMNLIMSFVIIIFSAFALNAQNTETIYLTNEDGGSITHDICYSQSKDLVFAYGYKNILVYKASTNELKFTVDLSQYGHFEIDFKANIISNSQSFMFVDELKNMMYYVTPNLSIARLDISDPDNIQNTTIKTFDTPNITSGLNIIKWDDAKRRFYWAFGTDDGLFRLHVYHIDNQNNLSNALFENNNMEYGIYDIAFTQNSNPNNDAFYVSRWGWINAYDAASFNIFESFYYPNEATKKKFFVKTTETGYNRLFCLPYNNSMGSNAKISILNTETHQLAHEMPIDFNSVSTAAIFGSTNNIVIGSSPSTGNDIRIYDTHSPYGLIQNLNTDGFNDDENKPYSMLYYNNEMFVSKPNEIIKLTKQTESYSFSVLETGFANYYNEGIKSNANDLFFINQVRSGIEKFVNQQSSTFLQTGTIAYESLFFPDLDDPSNNKLVFFSKLKHDNSSIVMLDADDHSNAVTFEFDDAIGDCIYNNYNGTLLLVTHGEGDTYLKVFNRTTNTFDDVVDLEEPYCGDMYVSPMKKIYVTTNMKLNLSPKIKILGTLGYYLEATIEPQMQTYTETNTREANFTFNKANNEVYTSFGHNQTNIDPGRQLSIFGVLCKFDKLNNYTLLSTDYYNPKTIVWTLIDERAAKKGRCYFLDNNKAIVWDCDLENEEATNLNNDLQPFRDIVCDAEKRNVYALKYNNSTQTNKVYSIDTENLAIDVSGEFGNLGVTGLNYNPNSYEILAYTRFDQNNKAGIYVFDPEIGAASMAHIFFDNKDLSWMGDNRRFDPTISFDTKNNKAFIPNGAHSNVSVIGYVPRERLALTDGTNWLSIPRLISNSTTNWDEKDATPTVWDRNNFETPYTEIQNLYHLHAGPTGVGANYNINWINDTWDYDPDIDDNRSTWSVRGYHLDFLPDGDNYIYMTGNIKDPATSFPLYNGQKNWVGYFLPGEQDVFDALGASTLENLSNFKHRDFYCYRGPAIEGPTGGIVNGYPWRCNQQQTNIAYGDMVILQVMGNVANFDMTWQNPGLLPRDKIRPEPSYFEFAETGTYTPILIELDYTNNPLEIGAFVDDSCMGAESVMESDTVIILRAYLNGGSPDSVVFQDWNGTKSAGRIIKDYTVYNPNTGIYENRALMSNTGEEMPRVSFRKRDKEQQNGTVDHKIGIWPNPAHNTLNYSFACQEGTDVEVTLLDISGKQIKLLLNERFTEGFYSRSVDLGSNLANPLNPGIYLVKFDIGGFIEVKKLVIN